MIVASAHGVKTPWKPCGGVLSYQHEYIITHGCSASLVRRRRVLLWRSRHRRQRAWPDSGDMPCRLSLGRIPHEKLIDGATRGIIAARQLRVLAHGETLRSVTTGMAKT